MDQKKPKKLSRKERKLIFEAKFFNSAFALVCGKTERDDAIKKMLNAPAGEQITLSFGEVIHAWEIVDKHYNCEDKDNLLRAYTQFEKSHYPEDYKIWSDWCDKCGTMV